MNDSPLMAFERVDPMDFLTFASTHRFEFPKCYHLRECVVEHRHVEGMRPVVVLICRKEDKCAFQGAVRVTHDDIR